MTEQQKRTRERYIEELRSTGRPGWGCVVSYLDSHRFFDRAHCSGHDRYPGGTANHSLWVLRFARETAAGIRRSRPGFEIPDDSLVFACLLHDVCDCNPRFGGHGRCSRHLMEHRIRGIRFTEEELSAVMAHMHGKLHVSGRVSRRSSDNFGEVLHYILHNSDHRSIEYGGEIPWNEEPRRIMAHLNPAGEASVEVYSDGTGGRYWWDTGGGAFPWSGVGLENMQALRADVKARLFIRHWPKEADLAVLENEQGNLGMFVLRRLSDRPTPEPAPALMVSEGAGFDFTEFDVYVSKYPKYRSSYVVARKTNGRWGVFSVKDQSADSNGYPIGITHRLDYIYDDPESAIEALRGNTGHPVRILHSDFFKHIVVRP